SRRRATARSACAWLTSLSTTSRPRAAHTCAMPEPIWPAPTTLTRWIWSARIAVTLADGRARVNRCWGAGGAAPRRGGSARRACRSVERRGRQPRRHVARARRARQQGQLREVDRARSIVAQVAHEREALALPDPERHAREAQEC